MDTSTSVGTRDLVAITDRLYDAVQMLHCLRPHCLDLKGEYGVDVGVMLGAIETTVTQQHDRLACIISGQLSGERNPLAQLEVNTSFRDRIHR